MSITNVCTFTSSKALPYVYMLIHRNTGQFYIGYREANILPSDQDLPIYGTSSIYVAKLGINSFDQHIIAEFYKGRDAYDFEQQLIREHQFNPLILNRHFLTVHDKRLRYIRPKGSYTASDETRIKLSLALKGRLVSAETRNRLSIANKGRKFSDVHKQNIGLTSKGRKHREETKAAISKALHGVSRQPFSVEWKANISKAQKLRDRSLETKKGSACIILGKRYVSISEASRDLKWSRAKIRKYLNKLAYSA